MKLIKREVTIYPSNFSAFFIFSHDLQHGGVKSLAERAFGVGIFDEFYIKRNLMVFLRPVVVRDSHASDALSNNRYQQMMGLQRNAVPSFNPLLDTGPAPTLPPLTPPGQPSATVPATTPSATPSATPVPR